MGAANVMRQAGILPGIAVALADIAKGGGAILAAQAIGVQDAWLLTAGAGALLGHNFPVYIGFRGGQGVACVTGVFLVLAPMATFITIGFMLGTLVITRHIFSSVILSALIFLCSIWLTRTPFQLSLFAAIVTVYMGFRSRHGLKKVMLAVKTSRWRNHWQKHNPGGKNDETV